jgi:hypothetical protein
MKPPFKRGTGKLDNLDESKYLRKAFSDNSLSTLEDKNHFQFQMWVFRHIPDGYCIYWLDIKAVFNTGDKDNKLLGSYGTRFIKPHFNYSIKNTSNLDLILPYIVNTLEQ